MQINDSQLDLVDSILLNPAKTLDGYQPHWTFQPGYRDFQLAWSVLEEDSGVERSQLRLRVPEQNPQWCSISYLIRGQTVCRIDNDSGDTCKINPIFAQRIGLPPVVCGPHVHDWPENRQYVASSGVWDVPARKPIDANFANINDLFFWLCNHINIRIQTHNTPLDQPDVGLWG